MKKIAILTIVFLLVLFNVNAFNLITNPKELVFNDILTASSAEKYLTIKTDSEYYVQVVLSTSGPLKEWFEIEQDTVSINKYNPAKIKIKVKPPPNIPVGNYESFIIISTISSGNQITSALSSASSLKTIIEITDEEIIQADVKGIIINNIEEKDPLIVKVMLENKGNVPITPSISVDVFNKEKPIQDSFVNHAQLAPFETKTIELSIPNNFPVGEYDVKTSIILNGMLLRKQSSTFGVLKKGTLYKEEELKPEQKPVPLLASPFVLIVWSLMLAFLLWKLAKIRKRK